MHFVIPAEGRFVKLVVRLVNSRGPPAYLPYLHIYVFTVKQIIPAVSLQPHSIQIPRVRDCSVTPQPGVNVHEMNNNALARSLSGKPDPKGHALNKLVELVELVKLVKMLARP